jgi:hypothetical protein
MTIAAARAPDLDLLLGPTLSLSRLATARPLVGLHLLRLSCRVLSGLVPVRKIARFSLGPPSAPCPNQMICRISLTILREAMALAKVGPAVRIKRLLNRKKTKFT